MRRLIALLLNQRCNMRISFRVREELIYPYGYLFRTCRERRFHKGPHRIPIWDGEDGVRYDDEDSTKQSLR